MIRSLNRVLVCLFLIGLLVCPITTLGQGGRTPPETVVRNFYSWYLHELYGANYKKQKTTALKYLTPHFYANAPRLEARMGADIFVCAQDWDETWEKNFTVGQPAIRGKTATTVVTLPSGVDKMEIKVTLKLIGPGWRIDGVQCNQRVGGSIPPQFTIISSDRLNDLPPSFVTWLGAAPHSNW